MKSWPSRLNPLMQTNKSPGLTCLESYRTSWTSTSTDPRRIRYSVPSIKSESRMTDPFRQSQRFLVGRTPSEMLQRLTSDLPEGRCRNRSAPTEGTRLVDHNNNRSEEH